MDDIFSKNIFVANFAWVLRARLYHFGPGLSQAIPKRHKQIGFQLGMACAYAYSLLLYTYN